MPRTILLFRFGDLGDTILTTPALRAVRTRHPMARLVLVGKGSTGQLVSGLGLVDEVIEVDKHAFDRVRALASGRALLELVRLVSRIRTERADTVVLFHHLVTRWGALKFAALSLSTGAPARLGLDNGRGWFLTRRVRDLGFGGRHEAEYWMEVAGLLDASGPLELSLPVSQQDRQRAGDLLCPAGPPGRRLVAIHAGTGWYGPGRRWPSDKFASVAERILEWDQRIHLLVVGTEEDRDASRAVLDRLGQRASELLGKTTVRELAAVLEQCELLIANDGGVAHLASATGTRVLAVFGPSNDAARSEEHTSELQS